MRQLPIEKRMRNAPRSALVLRCAMELHQANGNWITGERLTKKGTVSGSSEINHDNRDSGNRPLPVPTCLGTRLAAIALNRE